MAASKGAASDTALSVTGPLPVSPLASRYGRGAQAAETHGAPWCWEARFPRRMCGQRGCSSQRATPRLTSSWLMNTLETPWMR